MLEQHSFRPHLEARFAPTYGKRAVSARHTPRQNHLLAALPLENYERLLPDLEPVPLPLGWTVHRAGDRENYLYFLTAGIVSRFYVTTNGASAEFALTGSEGVIGIASFLRPARHAAPSARRKRCGMSRRIRQPHLDLIGAARARDKHCKLLNFETRAKHI